MRSGTRDRLITIERDTGTSEDTFGAITSGWTSYATAWAEVIYGTGTERRESASEGTDQPATFRVLAETETLAVTTADRISFDGSIWDIHNVSRLGRDGVEYTAMRRTDA